MSREKEDASFVGTLVDEWSGPDGDGIDNYLHEAISYGRATPKRSQLLSWLVAELADVDSRLAKGQGTWPQPDYIRDATWNMWQGERLALGRVLRKIASEGESLSPQPSIDAFAIKESK
jgi:hypothetical protein